MAKNWTDMLNAERKSVFGSDCDGASSFRGLPDIDPFAIAAERALPGDEIVTLEGRHLVTSQLREAHPLGMGDDKLFWEKKLVVTQKRKVRGEKSWQRHIASFFAKGTHIHVHNAGSCDNQLVELTHSDGRKTFLVGIVNVVTGED